MLKCVVFVVIVFVICARGDTVRQIMLSAYDLQLVTGKYVFFSYHPFNNTLLYGADSWNVVS